MKLKDKVALITGGAQGLGKSIALAMAREGANTVICDINEAALPDAAKEIEAWAENASAFAATFLRAKALDDVRADRQTVRHAAHPCEQRGARADRREERGNASKLYKMMTTPIAKESLGVTKDFPDEEWHRYWGVNVHGVFYCTREALRIMEPKKSGKIINIASIAGIGGYSAFHPSYCATKGAVLAFTRSVAIEVAGANIYVNAIAAVAFSRRRWKRIWPVCTEEAATASIS